MLDRIWQISARVFIFFAALVIILYGTEGLFGGSILPAAGRGTPANFRPVQMTGLGARLYGFMFFVLGFLLADVALAGRLRILRTLERLLSKK